MLFRGYIFYQSRSFYSYLIWPSVELKKSFQSVYFWIIKVIWLELIEEEKDEYEIINLVAFLVFCLLSLIFYYTQYYTNYIILASLFIWVIDYQLAKYQYLFTKNYINTSLETGKSDWVIWQIVNPDGKTSREKFKRSEISEISIFRYNITGGAFQEVMGTAWRVHATLCNFSEFLIYEEKSTIEAVQKAKHLATYFDIPLRFAFSEANSNYAEKALKHSDLNYKTKSLKNIKLILTNKQWKLYSQWNNISIGLLLRKNFNQSGFILFLLIMTGVMTSFGGFLNFFIEPLLGMQRSSLTLDISFSGILSFLKPKGYWKNIIQFSVAIGVMVYQGWQISKEKRIYIDKDSLNVFLGKRKLAQLKTNELEFLIFIKVPSPAILLIDKTNVVEINNFQDKDEFRLFLLKIELGVKHFQGV